MIKTPKAYRDDLSKDFWVKRKDTNEKINRMQDNSDFWESHKEEAIKVIKDTLYKELDDTIATEEYKDAKSKKQALRGKKKDVKKQEDIVAEQKKLLEDKEAELATMSEEYGEKSEKKESDISTLQKQIMEKAKKWTEHHRNWLQKKTDALVNNKDEAGLQQLNTWIDFDDGKLILNTKLGQLKFAPKQATYDDIKHISWIKKGKNVWTENETTKKKWLRLKHEAIRKIKEAKILNKNICKKEQYLAAANIFPWGDKLTESKWSKKAKDFFDLLWVNQFGFRGPDGAWDGYGRRLWSASASRDDASKVECNNTSGRLDRSNQGYGLGVWFLED